MAVVGPGYVQASALLAAARVDGNLREAIGASHSIDAEHGRCRIHDVARWRERVPAVGGRSEDQMIAVCPDDVKRAVRADRAGETLDGAVVVARKTAHVVDFHGVRPGFAIVGRSEEHTSELQSRQYLPSFPTRRSSDLMMLRVGANVCPPSEDEVKTR